MSWGFHRHLPEVDRRQTEALTEGRPGSWTATPGPIKRLVAPELRPQIGERPQGVGVALSGSHGSTSPRGRLAMRLSVETPDAPPPGQDGCARPGRYDEALQPLFPSGWSHRAGGDHAARDDEHALQVADAYPDAAPKEVGGKGRPLRKTAACCGRLTRRRSCAPARRPRQAAADLRQARHPSWWRRPARRIRTPTRSRPRTARPRLRRGDAAGIARENSSRPRRSPQDAGPGFQRADAG